MSKKRKLIGTAMGLSMAIVGGAVNVSAATEIEYWSVFTGADGATM